MAGGLVALFDDIAAFAKLAAASVDDIGAAAGRASTKAAGVLIDDAAVTPRYLRGFAASRELPIIKRIAIGSIRNKLLIILPVALVLSEFAPTLVEVILMCGGAYLSYEGAEKIYEKLAGHHKTQDVPVAAVGPDHEKTMVSGAIRTDLILSAEIMVIALKEVIEEPIVARALIMVVVALLVTVMVYGAVGLIVKMDDIGLALTERTSEFQQRVGAGLVRAMPRVMTTLGAVGTAAMVWVGGHILLVGSDELGWHWPYEQVHRLEENVRDATGALGSVTAWIANTGASAVVGLAVGAVVVAALHVIPRRRTADH